MNCNFYKPHPDLANSLMFIWTMEYKHKNNSSCNVRIVPSACAEIIFYFGDIVQVRDKTGNKQITSHGIISGQKTNYFNYSSGKYSGLVALALKPEGIKSILGIPANEITNLHLDAFEVFGNEGKIVKERVYLANNDAERIDIIQQFLISLLPKREENDNRIVEFVKQVTRTGGQIKINKLADHLNISKRQLERKVSNSVGLSPKDFVKVIRFQNVLFLKQKNDSLTLTELAYSAGYADQAHFTHDFKSLTGITPSQYFSECNAFSDYYSFI